MTRLLPFLLLTAVATAAEDAPTFRNDVLPILSKAGCNTGGCHGALAGKGGFRLSLFGYNPEADWNAITRESRGRRLDLGDPAASLFLTKPTTALAHKGGRRLAVDSEDYRLIARWIEAGAPPPRAEDARLTTLKVTPAGSILPKGASLPLTVTAVYSDGRERDVTRWAKLTSTDETVAEVAKDGTVKIIGPGQGAVSVWFSSRIVIASLTSPWEHDVPAGVFTAEPRENLVDRHVLDQLQRLHLKSSPAADDATLVRRLYLDLTGKLPTPEEAKAFSADAAPDRISRLTDDLMKRPEFTDYWTYKWSDVLLVNGGKLRPAAVKAYYDWVRTRVANNTPWDALARELVTARGSATENGATNFFAVHQDPETMAENVSQAFLSLSIGCAKCHNHPLEKWTNDQYYSFANLFARVRAKGWGGDPRSGDGQRTLYVLDQGDLIQPRTGRPQPPAPLDAPPIAMDDPHDRREVLAGWLASPANPYFTRAIVNRVWANFMGPGLVESVDDLRASNPASNEALLAALAEDLIAKKYDLRSLMKLIVTSRTYARSSRTLPENADDRRFYSHAFPRRLPAEVLSDAIADVTGVRDTYTEIALNDGSSEKTEAYKPGTRALQLADSAVRSYFLKTFGRNTRDITCECERSNQPSLVQVLNLSNGSTLNDKLAAKEGRITQLLAGNPAPEAIVEQAYQLCLSRRPTEKEKADFVSALATTDGLRPAVEDLFWTLITSKEFLFQH